MTKLSNSDSRTIRHACDAVSLVVSGAMRNLETHYGPSDNPDRSLACDALILHVREELEGWATAHEIGETAEERSTDVTTLADGPATDFAAAYRLLISSIPDTVADQLCDMLESRNALVGETGEVPAIDAAVLADLTRIRDSRMVA